MAATVTDFSGPVPVQRILPDLPVTAMKTYQVVMPLATHWRPASCAEVACEHYTQGWRTIVAADSPQAEYMRHGSGRAFTETRAEGGLAEFTFPPGQQCFDAASHRIQLDRPEIFIERGGDWRGNPRGEVRRHVRPDDWVDSFANHQQKLADRLAQG